MDLHVTTGGTALAERLDTITAAAQWRSTPGRSAWGAAEEYLTDLLLRHQLNQPRLEYDPTTPQRTRSDNHGATTNSQRAIDIDSTANDLANNDADDDPPPF